MEYSCYIEIAMPQLPFWQDSTLLAALLGAIVGGVLSLVGSFLVSARQQKQNQHLKMKEEIYKPLYESLGSLEYHIFPKPCSLPASNWSGYSFYNEVQSRAGWIEADINLKTAVEKLNNKIKLYEDSRVASVDKDRITQIIEQHNLSHLLSAGTDALHSYVLHDGKINVFHFLAENYFFDDLFTDRDAIKNVANAIYKECKETPMYEDTRRKHDEFLVAREEAIKMLRELIEKKR